MPQQIVFPVILVIGRILGKYRGSNWPGSPESCAGAPLVDVRTDAAGVVNETGCVKKGVCPLFLFSGDDACFDVSLGEVFVVFATLATFCSAPGSSRIIGQTQFKQSVVLHGGRQNPIDVSTPAMEIATA